MITKHCGYVFYLFLALWAELAAGRALLTIKADADMQSIIEDLQEALKNYRNILSGAIDLEVSAPLCSESAAQLDQSCEVVHHLSRYQVCTEQQSVCPDKSALSQVIKLNKDLLQHLDSTRCPPTSTHSSSSPSSHFNSVQKSSRCVACWSQQVAALRK